MKQIRINNFNQGKAKMIISNGNERIHNNIMPESIKVQFVVDALVINKHMKQQIRQSNKKMRHFYFFCLVWRFFQIWKQSSTKNIIGK